MLGALMTQGALLGGFLIEETGNPAPVFGVIGVLTMIIPAVFAFSPLGHAEDYIPKKEEVPSPAEETELHMVHDESTRELEEAVEEVAAGAR